MQQIAQKFYVSPNLTTYGRLENLTLIWDNPTAVDNNCPGAVGSENLNSGVFCLGGGGNGGVVTEGTGTDVGAVDTGSTGNPSVGEIVIPQIVLPELPAEELLGGG